MIIGVGITPVVDLRHAGCPVGMGVDGSANIASVVAVALADRDNLVRCLALVVTGAVAVIAIGYLRGMFVDTPVVAATNAQVAARVIPNLVDLVAALATGAVGSIAPARDDISDTSLQGAIAAAVSATR